MSGREDACYVGNLARRVMARDGRASTTRHCWQTRDAYRVRIEQKRHDASSPPTPLTITKHNNKAEGLKTFTTSLPSLELIIRIIPALLDVSGKPLNS